MKRTIVLPVLFGALIAAGAAPAHATPMQDSQYVACISGEGLVAYQGPAAEAELGQSIADDIAAGVRSPLQEAVFQVHHNTGLTQRDANVLVNCATEVWLGFGPEGPHGGSTVA